ncbi:flavin reductase family protein [Pseudonocardia sp. KRD291]|uniref:flavin reductase family protein n=1 Tax=Pseudonocardia sp. KRD291 TaxID=2792007 RepID=UPI001C4A2C89|nr:flavin reductase family protein [Pseudonocardia sp. KRD291]MBW0102549.1 flavin reductase family protein [Pseudonocardia sp. KRD291]
MIIDTSELDATAAYKLLIGSIVPRAIGWVSTLSVDGVANLAPISFFTAVGRKPPMVSLTMQPRSTGELKDTFTNIRDTGEFVTNLVSLPQAHLMHRTAQEFPSDVDEFDAVGLEKAPSEVVAAPRVRDAPIHFECRLERIIPVGDLDDHVVWGIVERVHLRDDLYLDRGRVDTAALAPVGRLAAEYTLVENVFTTPLDEGVLDARGGRMRRLDEYDPEFSPIDTDAWSPSGSVRTER